MIEPIKMTYDVDISETDILLQYPEVLEELLFDHTTQKNIFWATESYAERGEGFGFNDEIAIHAITGENGQVIRPRAVKTQQEQSIRTKDMAEVFTPSWVCNAQNNLVDEAWFGRKDVFNREQEESHTWEHTTEKIFFPEGKNWKDYVRDTRLEITCGEAPYLVSRYDTTTGQPIPINHRIGLLDRKLRVINENTEDSREWLNMVREAFKNTYGYEWQGDNLILAREALLFTFIEYFEEKFCKFPELETIKEFAHIISWNIWQMDGLKCVVPNSCHSSKATTDSIFGEEPEEKILPCPGCKNKDIHKHNGIYCKIMDWEANSPITFVSLIKKK